MAHVRQERRFQHVRFLGFLFGGDELPTPVLQADFQFFVPVVEVIQEGDEQREHDENNDQEQEVRFVFLQSRLYGVYDDTTRRQFIFRDSELLEFLQVETIFVFRRIEMYRPGFLFIEVGYLPGYFAGSVFVFGDVASDSPAADPRAADRKNGQVGLIGQERFQRIVHKILAVLTYPPGADQQHRFARQPFDGCIGLFLPVPPVDQGEGQVGMAAHFLLDQSLQRNTPVGIVR